MVTKIGPLRVVVVLGGVTYFVLRIKGNGLDYGVSEFSGIFPKA